MKKLFIFLLFSFVYFQIAGQTLMPYLKVNGKFIYVDSSTMKPAFDKEFDEAYSFAEDIACVSLNGKFGYIDKTGKTIIEFKYEDGDDFINGIARVMLDNKTSFINKTGKEIVPFKYTFISDFSDSIAIAGLNEKVGIIDINGKEIIPITYDNILGFTEGLARVELNGKFGFINKTGNIVVPIKYDDVMGFSKGLAVVGLNRKYGFIDKKGKEIIPLKYHHASTSFSEQLLLVTVDSGSIGFRSGFIDRTGKVVIPWKYKNISEFSKGIYLTKSGDKIQLINAKQVKLAEWDIYEEWRNISEGIAFLRIKKGLPDAGKYVMIDNSGKEITTTRFDAGGDFKNGIAAAKVAGKWGYIDKSGKQIIDCKYDDLNNFGNGIIRVKQNNQWYYIDKAGREYREQPKPLAAGWIFYDDFTDNRNNWLLWDDSTLTTRLSNIGYHIQVKENISKYIFKQFLLDQKHDYKIEASFELISTTNLDLPYGLSFGGGEGLKQGYSFIITGNGTYAVRQHTLTGMNNIEGPTFAKNIIRTGIGKKNKLTVIKREGYWEFFINDVRVRTMQPQPFAGDRFAFFVNANMHVAVSTFKVYNWTLAKGVPQYEKEAVVDVKLHDNFIDNKNQWPDKSDAIVNILINNYYVLENKNDRTFTAWSFADMSHFSDCLIEMEVEHERGTNEYGYGLAATLFDGKNKIVFEIADGWFRILKTENDDWITLMKWTETSVINKGDFKPNLLQLRSMGKEWKFYINKHLVATLKKQSSFGKYFGLYVQDKQRVRMNNIKVAKLYYPE